MKKLFAIGCVAALAALSACDNNRTADNRDTAGNKTGTDQERVLSEHVTGVQAPNETNVDKGTEKVQVQKEQTRTITSEERVPTVTTGPKKFDINRMTTDDFRSIGLSDSAAKSIVDYRDQHDGFKSVDELSQVPGVSPQMIAPLRDKLGMSPNK